MLWLLRRVIFKRHSAVLFQLITPEANINFCFKAKLNISPRLFNCARDGINNYKTNNKTNHHYYDYLQVSLHRTFLSAQDAEIYSNTCSPIAVGIAPAPKTKSKGGRPIHAASFYTKPATLILSSLKIGKVKL